MKPSWSGGGVAGWVPRAPINLELLGAGALLSTFAWGSPPQSPRCRSGTTCCRRPTGRHAGGGQRIPSCKPPLAAGFFGALGVFAAVLRRQGILAEAWYWTFSNHDLPRLLVPRIGAALRVRRAPSAGDRRGIGLKDRELWPGTAGAARIRRIACGTGDRDRGGGQRRITTCSSRPRWPCSRGRSSPEPGGAGGLSRCLPQSRSVARADGLRVSRCALPRAGAAPGGKRVRPLSPRPRSARRPAFRVGQAHWITSTPDWAARATSRRFRDGTHLRPAPARSGHPESHRPGSWANLRGISTPPPRLASMPSPAPGRVIPRGGFHRGVAGDTLPPDREDGGRRDLPADAVLNHASPTPMPGRWYPALSALLDKPPPRPENRPRHQRKPHRPA